MLGADKLLAAHAQAPILEPGPAQIPEWAKQGRLRFTRLDGGPIEIQKTERAAWGKNFTLAEKEVLANLYGKYGDRIADLLSQANINFVWITYSVGFSWEDEAAQRAACREITRKLHARGIKVAAYMCATSIFWESMFKDVPQSVKWLAFDSRGVPLRYSGGRDPLRFIANIDNPDWVEYQKRRVGAIIDDGLDAIFFDNTAGDNGSNDEGVARFFTEVRRYMQVEKHSQIPLFTNFGLPENRDSLNRMMEIVFHEYWQEPGEWSEEWNCSNVRRTRYEHGLNSAWKPLIAEYSNFHQGNRGTTFMAPHSQKLAVAEAAAFGAAQARDMEGPFDERLIAGDPPALASWNAIGEINRFLKAHEELYVGARNVAPLVVLLPGQYPFGFAWDEETHPIFDFLTQHNILYDIKVADKVSEKDLASYRALMAPFYASLSSDQQAMIQHYQAAGGKVYAVADSAELGTLKAASSSVATLNSLSSDAAAQKDVLGKIASLTADGTSVTLAGPGYVLANVTEVEGNSRIVLHLLNYASRPATNVRVRLTLDSRFVHLQGHKPTGTSPESDSLQLANVTWKGRNLEFMLPSLDTYAVVCLND
jgi:hypothetical protein